MIERYLEIIRLLRSGLLRPDKAPSNVRRTSKLRDIDNLSGKQPRHQDLNKDDKIHASIGEIFIFHQD